ncbi:MAG: hypothetical protein ACRELA_02205 [Candidatus Rokuibacteriota bacterium]
MKPTWDWAMLVVGTGLGVVALTADLIGIGAHQGFGWKQWVGTGAALLLVALGAARIVRREGSHRP